ncbi:hypothetical protein [Pedobacter caeni]|uniref:Uncharacterized protein n=1 Tax=Pedobacter caeni TaxID=288992 RepID=A0A1M5H3D3_9SPHI|nr:hypothetical protein [Pedobacter caeni]SHG10531.1 hypothetical protein SAMN04488522_104491 [Pedobacter caeni]
MAWYAYNGIGDPFIPSSYVKTTTNPTCTTGPFVCAIDLVDSTTIPTTAFNYNRLDYIANGLATLTPQPTGSQIYLYLKGCF